MPEEVDSKPAALPDSSTAALSHDQHSPSEDVKSEVIEVLDDDDDTKPKDEQLDAAQVAQAKVRYEADLQKHHYEPPVASRPQDE